jgi:hypothetical protein
MTASAKRDHRTASKPERVSGRVLNNDVVAQYSIRAVVDTYNRGIILIAHQLPPLSFFENEPDR